MMKVNILIMTTLACLIQRDLVEACIQAEGRYEKMRNKKYVCFKRFELNYFNVLW